MSSTYIVKAPTRAPYPYSKIPERLAIKICFSLFLLRPESDRIASLSAKKSHINKKQSIKSHLLITFPRELLKDSIALFKAVLWLI